MSNIIIPNQPEKPNPGIAFKIALDGPAVVFQVISTAILSGDDAAGLANALTQAAQQAKAFNVAIAIPVNGRNGQTL